VDERADQRARLQRVADGQPGVGLSQPAGELVDDGGVRDDPAHGRAALARGTRRGEHDAAGGQLQVRARRHDRGVVAAELQQAAPEPARDPGTHHPPHPGGAGGADQGHPRMLHERRGDVGRAGEQLADVAGRPQVGQRPVQQRGAGRRRQRRQLRRLPDHRVTADQADRGVPRPDGGREVERADHGDDAEGMPGLHEPVPWPLGWHCPAVELTGQPDGEVTDVDHLLDLAEGLGTDLADLEADQGGEIGLVLGQQLTEALQHRAAGRGRHRAPGHEGLLGAFDRRRHVGGAGPADRRQHAAVDRRPDRVIAGQHPGVAAAPLQGRAGQQGEFAVGG
jgi:hypothetical protein